MVQGLQLSQRLTQSLVLAPQLQQSLALLQAPTLELKALVEHELEQNPVLEEVAEGEMEQRDKSLGDDTDVPAGADSGPDSPEDAPFDASEKNAPESPDAPEPNDDFQAEFDKLVQLDQEWRDHFSQTNVPIRQS